MAQFIFPLRVYIEDTDLGGIVYHANYLKFFERARSEWAEHLGFGIKWQQENGILFPVRYAKIDYLKPAKVLQECEVVSKIINVRSASIIYDQYLRLAGTTDNILCKAEIKIACVDTHLRPRGLPKGLNQLLGE